MIRRWLAIALLELALLAAAFGLGFKVRDVIVEFDDAGRWP